MSGARPRIHVHALIDSLVWGGAELLLADYAVAAPAAGIDVSVGYLIDADGSPGARRLRARAGVEPELVPIPRLVNPRSHRMVHRHLERVAPDLVHTHLGYADTLGGIACRRLGLPTVSTLHVMEGGRLRDDARGYVMTLARRRLAARTITVSDAARSWLIDVARYPPERVVTVHNGVAAQPLPGSGREVRRELGIGLDETVLSMVTVLRPGKGHDVAVEAVRRLIERRPGIRLVIAGDGPAREQIAALAAGLGDRAILTGHRDDVMALLDATDVLVHPSSADAFPTTLIEAMAARVPVVSTRVGGIPEIVDAETTGILLEGSEALAPALERLLADAALRRQLGEAGRRRYEAEFTAERWAARLRALYDTVLGAREQLR